MATYILTTGSHSDYHLVGAFTGPDGLDVGELARRWAEKFPEKTKSLHVAKSGDEYFDANHFCEFVLAEAGLVPLNAVELWLPAYSRDMERTIKGEA